MQVSKNHFLAISIFLMVLLVASPGFSFTPTKNTKTTAVPSNFESPLVKTANSSTVYLISENTKFVADDSILLGDYNVFGPTRIVEQSYLNGLSSGGSLLRVVGSTANSDVYLIVAGIRLRFPSCEMVQDYGYSCNGLAKLTPEQLSRFSGGSSVTPFIKSVGNATVYLVWDGEKRPIASWGDLVGLGFPIAIHWLPDAFVDSIDMGALMLGGGGLIKAASSASVYAVNDWNGTPTVLPVTSFGDTLDLGLGTNVRTVPDSQLAEYTAQSNLKVTIKCGTTNYVGSNGILYRVDPSSYNDFNYSDSSFFVGGSICNRFTFSQIALTKFISNNGSIYLVEDGVKRGFTSYSAYLENGGNPATTISVSNAFAARLQNGAVIRPTTPRGEAAISNDIYIRVNTERAARGLGPLYWDNYLNDSARSWSVQMANSNNFAHSNLYPLLSRFSVAAENIGLGGIGTKSGALHNAWMNSTGHRVNLLGRNLDVIGIGVYCAPDGRLWVTQQFGRWPNSGLPSTFGPTPSLNPIVANDGGGATC